MKRLSKIKIEWSPPFAYAIGLITTDGCLSKDGRHVDLTSKDREQLENLLKCLDYSVKIGSKRSGFSNKTYLRVQIGDVNFYDFLRSIGLHPNKSKTLLSLKIPSEYFSDFLRGCIDGDGSIGFYNHPESKHPQLRIRLVSASSQFLDYIKTEVKKNFRIEGGWIQSRPKRGIPVLTYAKADSIKLFKILYGDINNSKKIYLSRKYEIVKKFYGRVAELV